jgi:hypothetical protein
VNSLLKVSTKKKVRELYMTDQTGQDKWYLVVPEKIFGRYKFCAYQVAI